MGGKALQHLSPRHSLSDRDSDQATTPTQLSRPFLNMDNHNHHHQLIKPQHESDNDSKPNHVPQPPTPSTPVDDKRNVKPGRVLNRVPRACNACRKQKMRCEGADNPPCRRCKHAGLECLFEKPSREATLTGEAGLERIRSLEASVEELKRGQGSIQSVLVDLVSVLRSDGRVPNSHPAPFSSTSQVQAHHSPQYSLHTSTAPSPNMSVSAATPSSTGPGPMEGMISHSDNNSLPPIMTPPIGSTTPTVNGSMYQRSMLPGRPPTRDSFHAPFNSNGSSPAYQSYTGANTLPPIQTVHPSLHHSQSFESTNNSTTRFSQYQASSSRRPASRNHKRPALSSSNVTSANSSSEEEDNGMGASGLVAPLEVLRDLADAAVASKDGGDSSEPASQGRSPEPTAGIGKKKISRPPKRRKTGHSYSTPHDVVTKGIITEGAARHLFQIFYEGCSTFLPVFDARVDTFDTLHPTSPFAVDAICMVAARASKGGGPSGEIFRKCLDEVQQMSAATLFQPVSRQEQVQAMVLVSGWSDNGGWLCGGHAVRMALELSMHRAWPKLKKRIRSGKASLGKDDTQLLIATRTWFNLYLMEHQMSYGMGRPTILKDDETIAECSLILEHPLSIDDDMRLVSTVELMAARERWQNAMGSLERPVTEDTFRIVREARAEFKAWYDEWDHRFAQKYPDRGTSFYRQSLEIQYLVAEFFHNATALRNIRGPLDVPSIPVSQWDIVRRSIEITLKYVEICLNGASYRQNLQNAVHYTLACAGFAGSFLLRLARLFPGECDPQRIKSDVERLASVLDEVASAHRFAVTLRLQVHGGPRRRTSNSLPPLTSQISATRDQPPLIQDTQMSTSGPPMGFHPPMQNNSPPIQTGPYSVPIQPVPMAPMGQPIYIPHQMDGNINLDQLWRGFENMPGNNVPMWLNDQTLGDQNLAQFGMESYMIPLQYDAPTGPVLNWS